MISNLDYIYYKLFMTIYDFKKKGVNFKITT